MRGESRRARWSWIVASVALAVCFVGNAEAARKPARGPAGDIAVMVVLSSGQRIEYSSEVRKLQLILDAQGHLAAIHLVLAKGPETDTHEWYNFRNLAGFSYRYLEITGRAKVSVLRAEAVPGQSKIEEKIPVVTPADYL